MDATKKLKLDRKDVAQIEQFLSGEFANFVSGIIAFFPFMFGLALLGGQPHALERSQGLLCWMVFFVVLTIFGYHRLLSKFKSKLRRGPKILSECQPEKAKLLCVDGVAVLVTGDKQIFAFGLHHFFPQVEASDFFKDLESMSSIEFFVDPKDGRLLALRAQDQIDWVPLSIERKRQYPVRRADLLQLPGMLKPAPQVA